MAQGGHLSALHRIRQLSKSPSGIFPVRVDSRRRGMWTKKNRRRYERRGLRYESDLTDEEYTLIEQFLPPERSISRRSLVNGILYILTTGCQWRQLPKD